MNQLQRQHLHALAEAPDPVALHKQRQHDIADLLNAITKQVQNHGKGTDLLHWGHAGDLGHVQDSLKTIHDFLNRSK